MPKIPLYAFQPQATQSQNVRADPGMYAQQANAAQRLGNAVAGLGEVAGGLAFKLQAAQNAKTKWDLQSALDTEWENFQLEKQKNSDETKWLASWEKRLDATASKAMPKEAGSQLRNELELQVLEYRQKSTSAVNRQAKKASVENAILSGTNRLNSQWRNGDLSGAEATLNEMASLDLIEKEKIPELMHEGQVKMERNAALLSINTDPIGAEEVLSERTADGKPKNYAHLDESDRYSLITQAERNASQLRAQTYQQLTERMTSGELLTKQELDGLVEKKLLTATQSQAIMRQQKVGKLDTGAFAEVSAKILNYERGRDTSRKEYAELFAQTLAFPEAARSALLSDLNKKDDPTHRINSPAAKDALQRAEAAFRDGAFLPWGTETVDRPGWFTGDETKVVPATAEVVAQWRKGDATKEVSAAANMAYANFLTRFRGYIDANPTASDSELQAYANDLMKPYQIGQVSAILSAPAKRLELSAQDKEALKWANENPNDPRSLKIKQRLGQ